MTTVQFYNQISLLENQLLAFSIKLTSNMDDAKDLVQETTFKALKYRSKYSDNTNFKAWILTIMKNTFLNNYKRSKKILNTFQDQSLDSVRSESMDQSTYGYIDLKDINASINALEDLYKIPFQKFVEGYKYDEIAEQLNIPIGTVKSRIFFARKKLQTALSDYSLN